MVTFTHLLCFASLVVCVAAAIDSESIGDWSNDFATDLGPLIALLGEQMTRQYLSESTSHADYYIFGLGPLGIINAMVSTVRLCGSSSFRAFFGRAQESDGNIEMELCTSTSRDVCELFTGGGISRVLGQPNLLELVCTPTHDGQRTKLALSSQYFKDHHKNREEDPDWKMVKGSIIEKEIDRSLSNAMFAPSPNISINVGIVRRPKWAFLAVSVLGSILHCGLPVLAGVGVWVLDWNLNRNGPAHKHYAPIVYILGTILLTVGLWTCAYLIGQSTDEVQFRRVDKQPSTKPSSTFVWLQPGPQRIGDQSFDPFAFFEDTKKPLQVWVTSKKKLNESYENYAYFAVLAVLIGYIMQFIGLRGIKAWLSIAHISTAVVMAILRGLLRTQRRGRSINQLADIPDSVSGHELEWLLFEMTACKEWRDNPDRYRLAHCHVTGLCEEAHEEGAETAPQLQDSSVAPHSQQVPPNPPTDNDEWVGYDELCRIRESLAQMTGQIPIDVIDVTDHQIWDDQRVKVRAKVNQISAALCRAATGLLPKDLATNIVLRIQVASLNGIPGQFVNVILTPPPPFSQAGWQVDAAQVEAVLGPWMWTLLDDSRLKGSAVEYRQRATPAEKVRRLRVISAGPDDDNWLTQSTGMQRDMGLWIGSDAVELLDGALYLDERDPRHWAPIGAGSVVHSSQISTLRRFCGWSPVHSALEKMASTEQVKLQLQLTGFPSNGLSLLELCAQDLYTLLISSLATSNLVDIGRAQFDEVAGQMRLTNKKGRCAQTCLYRKRLGISFGCDVLYHPGAAEQTSYSGQESHEFSSLDGSREGTIAHCEIPFRKRGRT